MIEKLDEEWDAIFSVFEQKRHGLSVFMETVARTIGQHPELVTKERSLVHSYKFRVKDKGHLKDKIVKKCKSGKNITANNLFSEVTDLVGVRILHLFQADFAEIDRVIRERVKEGDWYLGERPKAYTWDPEAANYFRGFDLEVTEKVSSYTSVHYLIKPRQDTPICCEVQVRTLFEEIWGEVDHQINYPSASESVACREQLMVLSKIVGAGSRLLDSLKRVYELDRDK